MGPCAKGGPSSPYGRRTPLHCGFSPTWGEEGGLHLPLSYIIRGGVHRLFIPIDLLFETTLSLLILPTSGSHCLELVLGWGFLHHMHAVVLLELGSESIFFRCSSGSEPGGTSLTPYACETTRCYMCGTSSSSGGLQHGHEVMGVRLHR